MMDEPEQMWDSLYLSSLVPLNNPHSPPHSPPPSTDPTSRDLTNFQESAWWQRPSTSPVLQVKLNGEVADESDLSSAATNNTATTVNNECNNSNNNNNLHRNSNNNSSLDMLLPLSVASGRIEKSSPQKNNDSTKSSVCLSSSASSSSSSAATSRAALISAASISTLNNIPKQQPQLVNCNTSNSVQPSSSSVPLSQQNQQPSTCNDIINNEAPDTPVLPNVHHASNTMIPTTPTDMDTSNTNVNLNSTMTLTGAHGSPVTSLISTPPTLNHRLSPSSSPPIKTEPLSIVPSSSHAPSQLQSESLLQSQSQSQSTSTQVRRSQLHQSRSQSRQQKIQPVRPRPPPPHQPPTSSPLSPKQKTTTQSTILPTPAQTITLSIAPTTPRQSQLRQQPQPKLSSLNSKSNGNLIQPSVTNTTAAIGTSRTGSRNVSLSTTSTTLKEKRQREARQFPKEALANLDGTTSAEVRKMNAVERELVLYKRKLRNRESARRSRQKRQATLAELQEEIDNLVNVSERMVDVGLSLRQENDTLRNRLTCALAELKGLRAFAGKGPSSSNSAGSNTPGQSAALNMKLGG